MPSSNHVIVVDLGGTNLRVGAVRADGSLAIREKQPSEARLGSAAVLGRVAELIGDVARRVEADGGKIVGVALGFPGIVDPEKGVVHRSPHFPDWKDLEVLSYFRKLPWMVRMDNDANLAALGEGWKGAARDLKNYVMMTFGTGIGGGIVADGRLLHGDSGFAGELGHLCIEPEGPTCACGSRGCLETYASATGLLRLAEISDHAEGREALLTKLGKTMGKLSVRDLYEAALDGDIFANGLFKRMGSYLGIGIASLANILGIENFILGGGLAEAWDFFVPSALKEISQRTYEETAQRIRLHKAALGDDAALVGGASGFFKS